MAVFIRAFLEETFHSLASALPQKPFDDSGRWWPITMAKYGMQRSFARSLGTAENTACR